MRERKKIKPKGERQMERWTWACGWKNNINPIETETMEEEGKKSHRIAVEKEQTRHELTD